MNNDTNNNTINRDFILLTQDMTPVIVRLARLTNNTDSVAFRDSHPGNPPVPTRWSEIKDRAKKEAQKAHDEVQDSLTDGHGLMQSGTYSFPSQRFIESQATWEVYADLGSQIGWYLSLLDPDHEHHMSVEEVEDKLIKECYSIIGKALHETSELGLNASSSDMNNIAKRASNQALARAAHDLLDIVKSC